MLISMNWIGDFVDLTGLDLENLIHRFTLSTAEVEDVIHYGRDTHGVIVAEIASIEDHPKSKKLHLLKINNGRELIDCVCGAPNVRVGMRVAFATEGGAVCGHPISRATVAGYESCGMCCSEAELGISADNSGLMEITDDIPLGTDIKTVYDIEDTLFEVDNKSLTNRPDLWGHYGIAREIATLAGRPLRPVPVHDTAAYTSLPAVKIAIDDPERCYRYTGIKVENIQRNQSPVNMRIRLFYCGSRAINLLADLTNYVMLELGQPMHAFDLRRVDAVEVRRFAEPFKFTTLDGNEHEIDPETLMICSHGEPVAVAGVMGGLNSEIENDTTSLLLESANFNAVSVRKSESKLGMRTDASMRYEKFLDPEMTKTASERFLALLLAIEPNARVISALTDVYVHRFDTITLTFDQRYVDRYTGITITKEEILRTLTALGFACQTEGDVFTVTVPSWRATKDVTIKADLIEEITRIYGYDNFEIKTTRSPLLPVRRTAANSNDNRVKDVLVSTYALHEVHSYIWNDREKNRALGIEPEENVRILNAGTPEHDTIRSSMIPTLLNFVSENRGYAEGFGLFEIGRTVKGLKENNDCNERKKLGIVLYDKAAGEEALYLRVRDIVLRLVRDIKHQAPTFMAGEGVSYPWQHPINTAAVRLGDVELGFISALHPAVGTKLDKRAACVAAELDMDLLAEITPAPIRYSEPSRFPGIDIDLTFATDPSALVFAEVEALLRRAGGEFLSAVTVTDVYEGEGNPSITFRLSFTSQEKTLSKAELQGNIDAILAVMKENGMELKTV